MSEPGRKAFQPSVKTKVEQKQPKQRSNSEEAVIREDKGSLIHFFILHTSSHLKMASLEGSFAIFPEGTGYLQTELKLIHLFFMLCLDL